MIGSIPHATPLPAAPGKSLAALGKAIGGTLLSNVSVFALSLATSVIINRALGPSGTGVYAMILTSAQLIALCASLGLAKSITYHVAQRDIDRQHCFANSLSLGVLSLGLGPLALLLLAEFAPAGVWREVFREFFWPIFFLIGLALIQSYGLGALRGLQQFRDTNLLQPANNLIFLGLLVACLFHHPINLTAALFSRIAAAAAIVGLLAWRLRKQSLPLWPRFHPATAASLLRYGFGYFGYTLFQNLNYRFDLVLVSSLTDHTQTGCYATAAGLGEILWFLPNAIGMVLLPVIIGNRGESGDWLAARICRISLPIMAVGVLALVLAGHWVVQILYGPAFLPAVAVVQALALGILTNSLYTVLGTHLASRNRLGQLIAITSTGFALNVLLNLWWIPRWGIVGAGLASSLSYSTTALLTARAFSRLTGIGWRQFLVMDRSEWVTLLNWARAKLIGRPD